MQTLRKIIFCIGAYALLHCSTSLAVQVIDEVHFAGASFIGNAADIVKRYPLISSAIDYQLSRQSAFDKLLQTVVFAQKPKTFAFANNDLTSQGTGDYLKGTGKALTFAFSHESVEVQTLGTKFVVVYDLGAQVMFFDYAPEAKHLLAAYPVRVRFSDAVSSPPTVDQQRAVIRQLLFDFQSDSGLVKNWLDKMNNSAPKGGSRLVTVDVPEFQSKALSQMPSPVKKEDYSIEVAQHFESVISDEWAVPMVPISAGHSSTKLLMVFANTDNEIELPPADWHVRTQILEFRKASAPIAGGIGEQVAYGAFITFAIHGPLGPLEQELKIRNVGFVTLLKSQQIRIDDWAQFKTVLSILLTKLSKQVRASEQDRAWILENTLTPNPQILLTAIREKLLR